MKVFEVIKKIKNQYYKIRLSKKLLKERNEFLKNGKIPWSKGYLEYKRETIKANINNEVLLRQFKEEKLPDNYGHRIDERVVEYPWILSKLPRGSVKILDAGSTFNFDYIVNHDLISNKDLTIYTFAPELNSFNNKKISYVYGDLRDLPFKNKLFDIVVSHSTIEHIDMDNSMYGYEIAHNENSKKKSYSYLDAIKEMMRVLKNKGNLLLTFPYGKFENHGFFQQFDEEMLAEITNLFKNRGIYKLTFFKYEDKGWRVSNQKELIDVESYNPHTRVGKKNDNAAHSRSIACVSYIKSK
jgi:SAM-dependent methyltransferase